LTQDYYFIKLYFTVAALANKSREKPAAPTPPRPPAQILRHSAQSWSFRRMLGPSACSGCLLSGMLRSN